MINVEYLPRCREILKQPGKQPGKRPWGQPGQPPLDMANTKKDQKYTGLSETSFDSKTLAVEGRCRIPKQGATDAVLVEQHTSKLASSKCPDSVSISSGLDLNSLQYLLGPKKSNPSVIEMSRPPPED